jgi:hypothetical protein
LLPFCYPNVSGAVYRGVDRGVNLRRGVLLHSWQDMAIKVQCDPDTRMPEALLRNLRVNAARQKLCCVSVPQVVKPNAREIARLSREADKFMREAVRL